MFQSRSAYILREGVVYGNSMPKIESMNINGLVGSMLVGLPMVLFNARKAYLIF